jgi:hypothetical protein
MNIHRHYPTTALVAVLALLSLSACKISTSHNDKGDNKDVDIKTPLGSISVHTGENDPKATGLALYPGAEPRKDADGEGGANVNVSSSMFGVKVVALKYRSADPPEKVLNFYRKEMARYGKVVDCTGGFSMGYRRHENDSEVTCDNSHTGREYHEVLRVGTENNQRDLAIRPSGGGSEFAIVYVRAWDDKSTM